MVSWYNFSAVLLSSGDVAGGASVGFTTKSLSDGWFSDDIEKV